MTWSSGCGDASPGLGPEAVECLENEARRLERRVDGGDESLGVARSGGELGEGIGPIEEAIQVANRKLALINDAYDRLRRERGLVPALS